MHCQRGKAIGFYLFAERLRRQALVYGVPRECMGAAKLEYFLGGQAGTDAAQGYTRLGKAAQLAPDIWVD